MDNKENRKFYWEIKDFMNNAGEKPQASAQKQPTVVNAVKTILEKKNPYKQETFTPNINSNNTLSQVLSNMEKFKKEGDPNCVGYSKNVYRNGFGLIREQEEDYFSNVLRQVRQNQNAEDINPMATADELANIINQEQIQPGVPLTQRQRTLRDMEARARAKENLQKAKDEQPQQASGLSPEEYAEVQKQKDEEGFKNADRAEVERGRLSSDEYSKRYGEAPQASDPNAPGGVQGGTITNPVEPAPQEDRSMDSVEDARSRAASERQADAKAKEAAKPAEPEKDEQLEKRVAGRIKTRERNLAKQKQEAAVQLAGLRERGPMNNTPAARAMHAKAIARLELRSKGEDLSVPSGLSDEQIRGQETRALERERRTKTAPVSGQQTTTPTPGTTPAPGAAQVPSTAPKPVGTTPTPGTTSKPIPTPGPRGTAMDVGTSAQSMSAARDRQAQNMFGSPASTAKPTSSTPIPVPGNSAQTSKPAQQSSGMGSLNTGGNVNTSARGLLGMGNQTTETQKEPTPGESSARETLGMGKPQQKPNPDKEKKVAGLQA